MKAVAAENMTVADAIRWAASALEPSENSSSRNRADANLLLRHTLGISSAELHAHPERALTPSEMELFRAHIEARLHGKPIQYITGQQEFFGLDFQVTSDVLIPRPETEHLVEAAISRLKHHPSPHIADVGTGSGAIAVAVAHALPRSTVVALDMNPKALSVATKNAQRHGVAEQIRFIPSDLLAAVQEERFDAILSNPPYVSLGESVILPREVREYEPATALFAGPTGLEFYRRLIPSAWQLLQDEGWLMLEIGHGQQSPIQTMLDGWEVVEFVADLQGIPRVVIARKPHGSSR